MSSRRLVIRSGQVAPEIVVHLDGRVQQGTTPPPSTAEALAETAGAADLVQEARLRADELLAQAAHEVTDVHAEAYRLGREAGYQDGFAAGQAEVAEVLHLVQTVARGAKDVRDQVIAASERDIVELVLDAVHSVIGEQTRLDPTLVMTTFERAADRLGNQNVVRVRVHPDDASVLTAALQTRSANGAPWEVLPDGSVGVGGCVIDTQNGEIDARLDVQLDAIAQVLRAAVPGAA